MSTDIDTSLQLSKVIAADPETVFRAWTDPEQVKLWSCPEGVMIDDVQIDLTVGGQYRICMKGDEGAWTAVGTYREIEPPRRLVYTWDWEEKEHKMSQHDRLSGDALLTAQRSHFLGGRGLHRDRVQGQPEQFGEPAPHGRNVWGEPRGLGDDRAIHVDRSPSPLRHPPHHLAQQAAAVGSGVLGIGFGKMSAQIPQRRGAQQGVAHRMQQRIGVRVALQAPGMGNAFAAQDQRPPRHQPMNVVTRSDPHGTLSREPRAGSRPGRPAPAIGSSRGDRAP